MKHKRESFLRPESLGAEFFLSDDSPTTPRLIYITQIFGVSFVHLAEHHVKLHKKLMSFLFRITKRQKKVTNRNFCLHFSKTSAMISER